MWSYRARLERSLSRWQQAGWVTGAGADAIRAELAAAGHGIGLAPIFALLGAILLCFGAMLFVAANWQTMSKLARLSLLGAGLWVAYGAAAVLFMRDLAAFAHAAVLAGVGLFGASIMLIAQMYHIEGHPPDAVLTWALGALLAGVAFRSNPALALAMLLVGLWSGWETKLRFEYYLGLYDVRWAFHNVHWLFLAGWAVVAAAFAWRRWRPGLHLAAATLSLWVVSLAHLLFPNYNYDPIRSDGYVFLTAIGILCCGAAMAGAWTGGALRRAAPAAVGYGMAVAFAGLLGLQFVIKQSNADLALLAMLTLGLLLGAMAWAWQTASRGPLWLGYAGFTIEILSLYFKTLGTLLDTSLFFLLAGCLVMALAAAAHQLHARSAGTLKVAS